MPLLLVRLLALGTPLPLSCNSEASLLRKALPLLIVPPVRSLKKSVMTRRTMFLVTMVPEMIVPMVMILMAMTPVMMIPNHTMMMMMIEPIDGLPGQDDTGMIIFNNLSIAIDRLMHSVQSSNSSSSCTKVHEPDTFDGTNPKKLRTFFIQCELNF